MKLYLLFLLACLPCLILSCDELPKKIDRGIRAIFFFGKKELPSNKDELQKYCDISRELNVQTKTYGNKCLTGLPTQIVNILSRSANSLIKYNCQDNVDEFMSAIRCLDMSSLKKMQRCVIRSERILEYVSRRVRTNDIVPAMCCGLRLFYDCVDSVDVASCDGVDFKQAMRRSFSTLFDDVIDFACSKVRTVQECRESYPNITNRLVSISKSQVNKIRPAGIIKPMVEIANRLAS